jgi:hypothetical protein
MINPKGIEMLRLSNLSDENTEDYGELANTEG